MAEPVGRNHIPRDWFAAVLVWSAAALVTATFCWLLGDILWHGMNQTILDVSDGTTSECGTRRWNRSHYRLDRVDLGCLSWGVAPHRRRHRGVAG